MPTLLMGMVLPYLYRYAEEREESAGKPLGRLNGWNTSGAVIGPLAASFLLLPAIGLWSSVLLLGLAYLAFPLVLLRSARARLATVSGVALLLFVANPATLPTVRVQDTERVLALCEGSDGTVAVV